jgi:RimJ/RimL family protein N-acetyltransferase
MPEIVIDDESNYIYKWVVSNLANGEYYGNTLTVGIVEDEALIAGLIFHKTNEKNVIVSAYSKSARWAGKRILKHLCGICFKFLKAEIITALTSSRNKKAKRFLAKAGFKFHGSIKHGRAYGSDAFIYQMEINDFKYREV